MARLLPCSTAALCCAALALAASASASPPTLRLLSVGGDGGASAQFAGVSGDGLHAFIQSTDPLTAADHNAASDMYDARGGGIALLSSGAADSVGAGAGGSSVDGSRYFFGTSDRVTAADTDDGFDIYERAAGQTPLLSGGALRKPSYWLANSRSGDRVFFRTNESLTSNDRDGGFYDVYEASAGRITLASAGGDGPYSATFGGISADGSHVIFTTYESLAAADADGGQK